MDYNFGTLGEDHLCALGKALINLNKKFFKDYLLALDVINNDNEFFHRGELKEELNDVLEMTSGKCLTLYSECMNNIQRILAKYL